MANATFRQLEIFLTVARAGGFSASAERLSISQMAVSKQIAALERNLGCQLFIRHSGRPAQLSPEGRQLLEQAPTLLDQAQKLPGGRAALPMAKYQVVRIGCGDHIRDMIFQPSLIDFSLLYPDLEVEFVEMEPTLRSVAVLKQAHVDFGYFTLKEAPERVPGELLSMLGARLFISPKHPLATVWTPTGQLPLPIIMPLSGSSLERQVIADLAEAGIHDLTVVARAQYATTRIEMAMRGVGAVCMLPGRAQKAVAAGDLLDMGVALVMLYRYVFRINQNTDSAIGDTERFFSNLVRTSIN